MFVLIITFFVDLVLNSAAMAEGGNIFINRAVFENEEETESSWYERSSNTGDVRCFCNLPICVSTGYMCKSSSGGCFSNLLHQPKGLHGCLELLTDKEQRDWCRANPSSPTGRRKHHPRSLLYCCNSDMCNHVDNPETNNLMDESVTILNERENSRTVKNTSSQQINALTYNDSEVWFKAATIAVPICGVIIVLILIVLAVRLLKTESHSHSRHKLGSPYLPTNTKKYCDKYQEQQYKKSQHPPRKECVPVHHVEEFRQIRTPLVQNEFQSKNVNEVASTKYLPCSQPPDSYADDRNVLYSNIREQGGNRQNIFCDPFAKSIAYDKANIKSDEGEEDKINR